MGFTNFLEKWFPTKRVVGPETIVLDVSAELFYKELALHTAINIIANAIAKTEINLLVKGEKVQEKDYYLLNVSPNPCQTSGVFWHKVIENVIRKNDGAYVVEHKGSLYCVDSYTIEKNDAINGNVYSGIVIGNMSLNGKYTDSEIYHFKMHDVGVDALMTNIGEEYGNLIKSAANAFKKSNGKRYRLKLNSVQAGDEKFRTLFENNIKKQLESYLKSEFAVYPEFEGTELINDSENSKNSDDIIKLRKDIFEMVANMLHIPLTLMSGTTNNMNEIVKIFLTFCIDPYCDMISETLNKHAGFENYRNNSKYVIDTTKIAHRDIFDISEKIDKLLASGVMCIDEIREKIGMETLETEWSRQHFMTKNYSKINEVLDQIGE